MVDRGVPAEVVSSFKTALKVGGDETRRATMFASRFDAVLFWFAVVSLVFVVALSATRHFSSVQHGVNHERLVNANRQLESRVAELDDEIADQRREIWRMRQDLMTFQGVEPPRPDPPAATPPQTQPPGVIVLPRDPRRAAQEEAFKVKPPDG